MPCRTNLIPNVPPAAAMESTFQDRMQMGTSTCTWILQIRSRGRSTSWNIALWMLFLVMLPIQLSLVRGRERNVGSVPLWTVDLHSVGFTGFSPKKETWGLHFSPNPLCFVDNKVLVATFITREGVTSLASRDQPTDGRPNQLHAIFLDGSTGTIRNRKEWSVPRPRGGIIAVGEGRFAVLTPAMIGLYSKSLKLLNEYKLTVEQQSHLWDFYASPTGKTILAQYHYPASSFQWIDSDSLQPQGNWKGSVPGVSISDTDVAFSRSPYIKSMGFVDEVLVSSREGSERTVCRSLVGHGDACGIPEFVSNDVLALWMPHSLRLVPKMGGDALLDARFRDDDWRVAQTINPKTNWVGGWHTR